MDPFSDILKFLMDCDCSIGGAGTATPVLPAVLLLVGFAAVLLRRRSK